MGAPFGSIRVVGLLLTLAACGYPPLPRAGDDPTGDGGAIDTSGPVDMAGEAPPPAGCSPTGRACNNCIDDDGDGRIDGFDPECTGSSDGDEASFATQIPGDNNDNTRMDCFFDGNSGVSDDGCDVHVCCVLGVTQASCPIGGASYDPTSCPKPFGPATLPQRCTDTCGKLTPPGCDCFGCCTECDPTTQQCYDILINPADSPSCGPGTLSETAKCPRCTKIACGTPACGGNTCILCPGQAASDLPASCGGTRRCPTGEQLCSSSTACPSGQYCANGCCIVAL
jgi:hypothetical protein